MTTRSIPQSYAPGSFQAVLLAAMQESANENLSPAESTVRLVDDLTIAGFAVRRQYPIVNYDAPIRVFHTPSRGAASVLYPGHYVNICRNCSDLRGGKGWLVLWNQGGQAYSAWFDAEGQSRILPDYRVINDAPVPVACAAQCREVA